MGITSQWLYVCGVGNMITLDEKRWGILITLTLFHWGILITLTAI